jgi:hypothetical protein
MLDAALLIVSDAASEAVLAVRKIIVLEGRRKLMRAMAPANLVQ